MSPDEVMMLEYEHQREIEVLNTSPKIFTDTKGEYSHTEDEHNTEIN